MGKVILGTIEILIDVLYVCCLTGIYVLQFCYEFKETRDRKKFVQVGNQIDLVLT